MAAGLTLLLEAHDLANDLARSPWDFAVEIHLLSAARLSHSALRWLSARGYVLHQAEQPHRSKRARAFTPEPVLVFRGLTCFVLTETGVAAARAACAAGGSAYAGLATEAPGTTPGIPHWDAEHGNLWWAGRVVKYFARPARNQMRVLDAFEEDGWPWRLDNPLAPTADGDHSPRLHDAVIRLNRQVAAPGLRFRVAGRGQAVLWEPPARHFTPSSRHSHPSAT
jgi:hypothetical protein